MSSGRHFEDLVETGHSSICMLVHRSHGKFSERQRSRGTVEERVLGACVYALSIYGTIVLKYSIIMVCTQTLLSSCARARLVFKHKHLRCPARWKHTTLAEVCFMPLGDRSFHSGDLLL